MNSTLGIFDTLPFRGDRNYLHGTTLFSFVAPIVSEGSSIVFRINKAMKCNKVKVIFDVPSAELNSFPSTLTWEAHGIPRNLAIAEDGIEEPEKREPYDDTSLLEGALFLQNQVKLQVCQGLTFIETIVALNKALLTRISPLSADEQYVFSRLELERLPVSFLHVQISFMRRIGFNHFVSKIIVENSAVGSIHFSLWSNRT